MWRQGSLGHAQVATSPMISEKRQQKWLPIPPPGERPPVRLEIHGHGVADYPPGSTFGPRTLQDYELVWIVEGDVVWEVDGNRHVCPPGSILCCRPGQRDGFIWDPRHRTRHGYVHFAIVEAGDLPTPAAWPTVLQTGADDILLPLLEHVLWLLGQSGAEVHCHDALTLALRCYGTGRAGTDRSPPSPYDQPLVEGLLIELRRRWQDGPWLPPAIDELAATLGVTRAHLGRILRRELDVSPQELLRCLRLERAASLLARGNLPVQDVASRCGFESAFHFSRRFSAAYGCAPREFRARILAGGGRPNLPLVRVRQFAQRFWRRQG